MSNVDLSGNPQKNNALIKLSFAGNVLLNSKPEYELSIQLRHLEIKRDSPEYMLLINYPVLDWGQ